MIDVSSLNRVNKKYALIITWLIAFLGYFIAEREIDSLVMMNDRVFGAGVLLLIVYAFVLAFWCIYTKKYFSMFFIFLVYCFLFNAGQVLLGTFDIEFEGIVKIYEVYSHSLIADMCIFQSRCVLALSFGAMLAYKDEKYKVVDYSNIKKVERNILTNADFVFLISAALLIATYLREVSVRGMFDYNTYYYEYRSGVSILLLFVYHVFMFNSLIRHNKDAVSKLIFIINCIMCILMVMVGSRNAILQILFGSLFILFYVKRGNVNISFKKLVLIGVIGIAAIVLTNGVQQLRAYSLSELSLEMFLEVYGKGIWNGIVDSLQQMGGSARCTLTTMQYIDSNLVESEPTILFAFLKGFIPIPIIELFGLSKPVNLSLSTWVTAVGGSQSGWGYTFFAEAYYDFGSLGFLYTFIWGFVFVVFEQYALKKIKNHKIISGCSIIYVLAYGIFIARADMNLLATRTRYCVYILIIEFLYTHLSKRKHAKTDAGRNLL